MQERDTSGNITPPPSVNESEAQDIGLTTGNQMGEAFHAKNTTYMQMKKRTETTYEEYFSETKKKVELILMKKNLSIVFGIVVKKAEWRTEIQCEGRISKCYVAYDILSPPPSCQQSISFPSYPNLSGPSAHPSYIWTLRNVKMPSETSQAL